MAVLRPIATNEYQQFRYDLERESPRAAYWLESMIFGIMAQIDDMNEDRALELACKIVAHDGRDHRKPAKQRHQLQPA